MNDAHDDMAALGIDQLAAALKALGSPTRLELMGQLRLPTPPRSIRIHAGQHHAGQNRNRPVALQVVLRHLNRLLEHDLVREEGSDGARHFVLNRTRLYALTEELRQLTTLSTWHLAAKDGTVDALRAPSPSHHDGPRLVLAHGAYEGKPYPLDEEAASHGGWSIGRADSSSICLDYDPFVSRNHAEIVRTEDGFAVIDKGTSRNGTLVNWMPAQPGTPRPLVSGDIIGIGRSMLVCAGLCAHDEA